MKFNDGIGLSLCLAFMLSITPTLSQATPGETQTGQTLPKVNLRGLNTPNQSLAGWLGKPLLINVWASWCVPCRQEMASIIRLKQTYAGQKFNIIGISTDDYLERAQRFVTQFGLGLPNYIDQDLELEKILGADRLPLTVLVNAQGVVLAKYYGSREWDDPEALAYIEGLFRLRLRGLRLSPSNSSGVRIFATRAN